MRGAAHIVRIAMAFVAATTACQDGVPPVDENRLDPADVAGIYTLTAPGQVAGSTTYAVVQGTITLRLDSTMTTWEVSYRCGRNQYGSNVCGTPAESTAHYRWRTDGDSLLFPIGLGLHLDVSRSVIVRCILATAVVSCRNLEYQRSP